MYAEFYGLATRPFQLTPDARFFFESSVHRQAMAYMVYGLHHAEGFIIITGEVGAGKTILVDNLLTTISPESFVAAKIVTSQLGGDDLLHLVAAGFGVAQEGLAKGALLQRISDFVLAQHRAGRRALLIVDEAYVEFADAPSQVGLIDRYEHVAILRTLSKAWALAGARIGTLLAHAEVIALLRRIMPPYPLPLPCVEAALAALSPLGQEQARGHIDQIKAERARMTDALATVPGVREVLPSQANFLAVRFDEAGAVYQRLLAAGIVVRDVRRYPNLGDALRITIGTPAENARVLDVLSGQPA